MSTHGIEPWLDKRVLAEHLCCSARSIQTALSEGLPHAVIFGRVKFQVSQVESWLEAQGYLVRWTDARGPAARARPGPGHEGIILMPAKKRKRWSGRVYLGRDENDRQQFWWVGRFATKHERDDAVAKARTERPWEIGPAPDEMTCDHWADRFLARMESGALRTRSGRRLKASSIGTARGALKAFRAEFGHRTPRSITRVEAEDWAARVPASKPPTVIALMNDLYRAEEIDRNRFEGLSRRAVGRKDKRPPSEEEMLLLLDGCGALGDAYAPMMRAMFTFGAYTIMRPGELVALTWEDIDLDAGSHGRAHVRRRFYEAAPTCRSQTENARSRSSPRPEQHSTRCSHCPATTHTGSSSVTRRADS